jgi:hypothetical protein
MTEQIQNSVWVINSNLARPVPKAKDSGTNQYETRYLDKPKTDIKDPLHVLRNEELLDPYYSVYGFYVPRVIRLRLYTPNSEARKTPEVDRIAKLGHGLTVFIEREAPDTRVSLNVKKQSEFDSHYRLTWDVEGVIESSYLGEATEINAVGVQGHAVAAHDAHSSYAVLSVAKIV